MQKNLELPSAWMMARRISLHGGKIMRANLSRTPLAVAVILSLGSAVAARADAGDEPRSVAAGSTWTVAETTRVPQLSIADGATVAAAPGHNLTLTVNGIDVPLKPGVYQGDVVLTPTEDVQQHFNSMGVDETYHYRSALYIDNGARVASKSVAAAVMGGVITDTSATNIAITSKDEKFNGILVTGDSTYNILNARIDLTGNGGNDFAGFGAAIKSSGNAQVTVEHAAIITHGVVRTAVFVAGHSTMHVNNSNIEVHNGTLPADYKGGPITGSGGVMMEPPWMLGVVGNVRATNVVENGTAYYTRSHIKAQGWGALSTDATVDVHLYATQSVVETVESGYGAYADGVSHDTFSGCTFNVADYGLIMTGGSGTFTDKTIVNSRRFGVMMHSGGSGTLTIDKGSQFKTHDAVIQVKSSFPTIIVDNAKLTADNGVILEAIINDDPKAGTFGAGAGAPAGAPGGPPGPGAAGAPPGEPAGPRTITASFRHVTLNGDIINSMTALAGMSVTFEEARIRGGISTATATHAHGEPTAKTYHLIGDMKHTFGRTAGANGLQVTLGHGARWVINKTSYLSGLVISDGAHINAPQGHHVALSVDGQAKPLSAGSYQGAIVLEVSGS